ncbi:MAG: restriction endonuclease [Mediterraneibacter faecis]
MSVINFKEIPQANKADGKQDSFELFAREFLHAIGLIINEDPDRGQDGGRDLIVIEKLSGILGDSEIRWLVSCKHKVHSGSSVGVNDEEDISDRVQVNNCDGFIAFYSTIPSSGLARKFQSLRDRFKVEIFDSEKIERILLENEAAYKLIKRFFPESYEKIELKSPSNILSKYMPLRCNICGKDLLQRDILDKYEGVIVFVKDIDFYKTHNGTNRITEVYCACKGICDRKQEIIQRPYNFVTGWEDISDLVIPTQFLKFLIGLLNRIRNNDDIYEDEAFSELKRIIISLSQITMKKQTEKDIERVNLLSELPDGL